MIILDTKNCPVALNYVRTYDVNSLSYKKDLFSLHYKNSGLSIHPHTREIKITGDIREIALGLAMLIAGTIETIATGLVGSQDSDIINDAFTFSKEGIIIGSWIVDNMDAVKELTKTYNNIYPTVMLLKD